MKRKLASALVVLSVFSFTISSAAAFTPPGLAKKGGMPPGIQKKISGESWHNKIWEDKSWKDYSWDDEAWEDISFESLKELIEELKERFGEEIVNKEYETTLEEVDARNRKVLIEDGTAHIYLSVAEDAEIELDDKDVKLSSLSAGDEVYLKLNEANTVTEIKVIEEAVAEETEEYEGKLINKYSNDSGDYILIEIDEVPAFFYIDKDLRVSQRLIDEEVIIEVEDDVVVDINRK